VSLLRRTTEFISLLEHPRKLFIAMGTIQDAFA